MNLSFDQLLLDLAQEYYEKLSNSFNPPKLIRNSSHERQIKKLKKNRDQELVDIEDEISMVLCLRESSLRIRNVSSRKVFKKKKKYEKHIQYFTDPSTGERVVMSYSHSTWYQSYVLNTKTNCSKWLALFRFLFRMPYGSYLDLVKKCKESSIFDQWVVVKPKKKTVSLDLLEFFLFLDI